MRGWLGFLYFLASIDLETPSWTKMALNEMSDTLVVNSIGERNSKREYPPEAFLALHLRQVRSCESR